MSCDWAAKLDRYVDGELPHGELTELEAHLRGCPACTTDALGRLQLKRMTEAAGRRYAPTPEFRRQIEQSIGTAGRPRWTRRWALGFAAAAALVLVLISADWWLRHSRNEQALRELADLHVSTLASPNPVDVVSSDRHTVKPWFQGKLPFSFNLPDLDSLQFKLIGGRVAYFQQSPGAQLLFEIRKHQMSVFIFQDRDELSRLNAASSLRAELAFNCETWAEGGLRYFVISDASAVDVHGLSEVLKTARF